MTSQSPTLRPAIYLDPSVIEDAIRGRMRPRDRAAVCRLAAMVSEDVLSFSCPRAGKEAIRRAPPDERQRHEREYLALKSLCDMEEGWLDDSAGSQAEDSPDFPVLVSLLADPQDARHALQARSIGLRDVVVGEHSSLLRRAGELEARMGLRVFLPADYLSRWSTQRPLPG